jgi:hypothetical protein
MIIHCTLAKGLRDNEFRPLPKIILIADKDLTGLT